MTKTPVRTCMVDESSPGKMRKDNSNNAAQPDHRSVDYNQWLRVGEGPRSERNGRKRRRSRSGLIAPQILTWLILPPGLPIQGDELH